MPQLDAVTFFSQFFWLCVFFFGFYLVISKDFLPKMGRILKLRKKKMNLSGEGVQSVQQENEKVRASGKTLVENSLNVSSQLLFSHLQRIELWVNNLIRNTNKKQLENTNRIYVEWIGDNSIGQQIALQAVAFFPAPQIFASILFEKCKGKRPNVLRGAEAPNTLSSSRPDSLDQPLLERKKRGGITQIGKSRAVKK